MLNSTIYKTGFRNALQMLIRIVQERQLNNIQNIGFRNALQMFIRIVQERQELGTFHSKVNFLFQN